MAVGVADLAERLCSGFAVPQLNIASYQMPNSSQKTETPIQSLHVYAANRFCVTDGANFGDPLAAADDLMLDDTYTLDNKAQQIRLTIAQTDNGSDKAPFVIVKGTGTGTVGNPLHLDCAITLMGPDGVTFDAVVLVEVDPIEGAIEDFTQAIKILPQNYQAYLRRGHARKKKGDYPAALADYDQVLKSAPENWRALGSRGIVLARLGRRAESINSLKQALMMAPDRAKARFARLIKRLAPSSKK